MSDSSKSWTDQHDVTFPQVPDPQTPEDQDDDILEGAEIDTDLDKLEKTATGDEENLPINKKVAKDEWKLVKDLTKKQQK